jgi:hypothetical protein
VNKAESCVAGFSACGGSLYANYPFRRSAIKSIIKQILQKGILRLLHLK